MRLFVGIDLNQEIRQACVRIIDELMLSGAALKTVAPENIHITLKFLGEVREGSVKEISRIIQEASSSIQPFRVGFSVLGYFGSTRFPRTIWVGISEGRETISSVIQDLDKRLSHIRSEERKPKPHMTLARVRSFENSENLIDAIQSNRDVKLGELLVNEIKLKRSVLKPDGPVYSDLEAYELGKEINKD